MSPSQDTLYYIEKGFGGNVLKSVETRDYGEGECGFVLGEKNLKVVTNKIINDAEGKFANRSKRKIEKIKETSK